MKKLFILAIPALFSLACITPNNPIIEEEFEPIRIGYIDTGGYCLDLDINDSTMVVAADQNGLLYYDFSVTDSIATFNERGHDWFWTISVDSVTTEIDTVRTTVDSVELSSVHNFSINMVYFEGIYFRNLAEGLFPERIDLMVDSDNRDFVRSFAFGEEADGNSRIFTLNHNVSNTNTYITIRDSFVIEFTDSTVLYNTQPIVTEVEGPGLNARHISFSNGILAVSDSQLGVHLYEVAAYPDATMSWLENYDTAGEVECLHSDSSRVFTGLSHDFGVHVAELEAGQVANSVVFAEGYTVRSIDSFDNLVALACGPDGAVLYDFSSGSAQMLYEFSENYVFNVQFFDKNTVFVASRAGVEVFKIQ